MKIKVLITLLAMAFALNTNARDTKSMFSVEQAMSKAMAKEVIDGSVKFYFGDTKHAKIQTNFGEIKTNKKTNAFGKSDQEACDWAFASAIKAFHAKAKELGANAVVNIKSNYKNNPTKSDNQYQCGAGNIIAGVALKGDFVKL